jgi:hypothetical protein
MTIAPCLWGPITWTFLHLLSFNYEPKNKNEIKNYLYSLGKILPCDECRAHFNENIENKINGQTLDDALNSKETFTKYMYDFHNLINTQTGKTTWPTYEEIVNEYEPLVSLNSCSADSCSENSTDVYCRVSFLKKNKINADNKDIALGILSFIIVVLLAYVAMKYFKENSFKTSFKKMNKK